MKNSVLFAFFLLSNWAFAQNSSLEAVYNILEAKCATCHSNANPAAGLDLQGSAPTTLGRSIQVAQKMVNITPQNATSAAKGEKLIYPGRPDRSFLFRKINEGFDSYYEALGANEGQKMPAYGGPAPLTNKEKEIIRQWVLFGANTGGNAFDLSEIDEFYDNNGTKSFPDGPPPAPAANEGFQVKMGPFFLEPGSEDEFFQKYELNLPADVEVDRIDMKFPGYSHHLIVYNFGSAAAANQVGHGLRRNANHSDVNLTAAVQEQIDLRLPATTAFFWDNDLILDLNSHYINYSQTSVYQAEVYMNVYTKPIGWAEQEMHADLIVKPNIPIPNNGNTITHNASAFQWGGDDIHIWGMMGHTHKYGKGYQVWERQANGQKGDLIYDASCPQGIPGCPAPFYDYRHIPMRYWEPLKPIDWSKGIIHEAKWENDGPASVNFGPTSDDEMMVLIVFYTENPLTVDANEPDLETSGLAVYPNPSSEFLYFSRKNSANIHEIRLFDAFGRIVRRASNIDANSFGLNISDLPKGVYVYQVDGQRGGKVVVE